MDNLKFILTDSGFEVCLDASLDDDETIEIVVPDQYDGLPVLAVANNGFRSELGGISSITLPKILKSIGCEAFWGNDRLKYIAFPTVLTSIGAGAFQYCRGLVSVEIPHGVLHVENYTFECCSALVKAELHNNLMSIGAYAFSGCINLAHITLYPSLEYIGKEAFAQCDKLSDLFFAGTKEQWDAIEKDEDFIPEHTIVHTIAV